MLLASRIYPVVVGAMIAAPLTAHRPMSPGYAYDIVQRTKTVNPMTGTTDVVALRAHVSMDAAGNARIDILEAAQSPRWGPGDYAIVSGGKGTAQGKMDALAAAGVRVGLNPTEAGELMAQIVAELAAKG